MPTAGFLSKLKPKDECNSAYEFLRKTQLYFLYQNSFTAPSGISVKGESI